MKVFIELKTPWHPGHPDRRHRWLEGHRTCAKCGVPGDHTADLPRASDPLEPGLCQLERSAHGRCGHEADLLGGERGGGVGCARRVRARPMGPGATGRSQKHGAVPGTA